MQIILCSMQTVSLPLLHGYGCICRELSRRIWSKNLFRNGRCTESILLYSKHSFAVGALRFSNILETLNSQDISEVNSVLSLAGWTRSETNLVVDEDVFISDEFGSSNNTRCPKGNKQERINTDKRFNDLESDCEPCKEQN